MKNLIAILICLFAFQIQLNGQVLNKEKNKDLLSEVKKNRKERKADRKKDQDERIKIKEYIDMVDLETLNEIKEKVRESKAEMTKIRTGLKKFASNSNCNAGPCKTFKNDLLLILNNINIDANAVLSLDENDPDSKPMDLQNIIDIVDKAPPKLLYSLANTMETNENTGEITDRQWIKYKNRQLGMADLNRLRNVHDLSVKCKDHVEYKNEILNSSFRIRNLSHAITFIGTAFEIAELGFPDKTYIAGVQGWVAFSWEGPKTLPAIGKFLNLIGLYLYNEYQYLYSSVHHCILLEEIAKN